MVLIRGKGPGLDSWTAVGWMLRSLTRPLVGALTTVVVIHPVGTVPWPPAEVLVAKVAVGVAVYVGTCLLLWVVASRPPGPETMAMVVIAQVFWGIAGEVP